MKKTREEVSRIVTRECEHLYLNLIRVDEYAKQIEKRFGIPIEQSIDLLLLRTPPEDCSDFIMFALLTVLRESYISKVFTDSEIKEYSNARYEQPKLKFPLKFKMHEVAEGQQYIGTIDLRTLMTLRNGNLIRYNEETQRTMKRIVLGDTCYYQISLDRKAVNSIKESIENGLYIPTTLTFNIPEDVQFDYDGEYLTIKKADHLDIIDGYHRFIALSKVYDADPSFEYNMEIRLVSFSDQKAKQFIWQEDQKTKMKKIESDSLNQTNPAVKIVQQLNTDSNFILAGKISRNNGIIDMAEFTQVVGDVFYSKKIQNTLSKSTELQYQIGVKKLLLNRINEFVETYFEFTESKWDYKLLVVLLISIQEEIPFNVTVNAYENMTDEYIPMNKKLSTGAITKLIQLIREEG